MSACVLNVDKVGKRYVRYASTFDRFANWVGIPVSPVHEFWAVRDVSFQVRAGEALAIIGQNGAGKSTLLKMITGVVQPSVGRIGVEGRISAILELGLGFNKELTGRQNVYQAGGLMSIAAEELTLIMPEIEDFAELGEFFDEPLRTYSSGMQARLAFSLATAIRPDILIVDEILSVGDRYFQHKSFSRIRDFKEQGTSILFVTHNLGDVRTLCDHAILLADGYVKKSGAPDEVVDFYNAMISEKENAKLTLEQWREKNGWLKTRSGTFEVKAVDIELLDAETRAPVATARVGQKLIVRLVAQSEKDIPRLVLGFMIRDRVGHVVWGTNTWHTDQMIENVAAGEMILFELHFVSNFGPGSYSLTSALTSSDVHLVDNFEWLDNAIVFEIVNMDKPRFIGSAWMETQLRIKRGAAAL